MKQSNKNLYITLTIVFSILHLIFKFLTIGWMTLIFGAVFSAVTLVYFVYGLKFACKEKKEIIDHVLYWLISIFWVLFAFFFVDGGDVSMDIARSQIIKAIPYTPSMIISTVCGGIAVVLLIVAGIIALFRKMEKEKK